MNAPVIDHLDTFEEAIVVIAMRNIILDRAALREIEAHRQREAEADGWCDAEATFRRTGGQ